MTWRSVRVQDVVEQTREPVDPQSLDFDLVEHYSIPSLEATGLPELVSPEEILSNKQVLAGGEVMLSRLNPRKARVLSVPESKYMAVASTEFVVMLPNGIQASFFVYLLLSEEVRQYLHSCVQSVTRSHQRIRPEHLLKMSLDVPTDDTQVAIASFLDAKTGQIDELVKRKRELIERLDEYRAALITRTVTRGLPPDAARAAGLNPSPPLKPSGIDWLGDIPHHWEVRRLKDIGALVGGSGFPNEYQGVDHEELPFFKVGDLDRSEDGRWLVNSDNTISRETASELRARILPSGAIVYAKIGAALLLNRRRVVAGPSCIDNNMSAYIPESRHLRTLWALYALSILDFRRYVNPGAVPSLSEGDQAILPIPLPPRAEQQAIADFLNAETQRIDTLKSRVETAIERLQEYRTALVTAAVTGQIDVRDWAPSNAEANAA